MLFKGLEKREKIAPVDENYCTCFRYGFERYPLSLPKFNLDDRRGVFAIIYPHKFPQSVYFCRQAQHLRNIRSQRVSFETVLKTRHFHRQVRCFRVFQDPKKHTAKPTLVDRHCVFQVFTYYFALAEAHFCRQARLFQHILSQGIGLENAILHEGARNLPIACYLIKSGFPLPTNIFDV